MEKIIAAYNPSAFSAIVAYAINEDYITVAYSYVSSTGEKYSRKSKCRINYAVRRDTRELIPESSPYFVSHGMRVYLMDMLTIR